ncbi:MAG TPA: N-methyl-L-tryptophan oxidase [Chthoniobacterales bacterium]|jgi:sarcosine oxidase
MRYDVAVIGLGCMGSAILAECACRGSRVIGLEQFQRGHTAGSSNGKSRMIRKAYFEDPAYVPLLLRAYDLWRKLEEVTGEDLLRITGLLMVGSEDADIIVGAECAAQQHDLPLEVLGAREIRHRYPILRIEDNEMAVFETDGGVIDPERAVEAHLRVAAAASAVLHFGAAMASWEPRGDGFMVQLANGTTIESRALILSLGPWLQKELEKLGLILRVQRNVQAWFTPATGEYVAGRFPAFLLDRKILPAPLYGFPDFGDGVKAAFHSLGACTDMVQFDREISQSRDIEPIVRATENWMPGAAATFRAAKACPYSLTPDGHFVIDHHPDHSGLILCGGFSGHGFKFAPVVGEICADLAFEATPRHEVGFLSLRRFGHS